MRVALPSSSQEQVCACSDALSSGEARSALMHMHVKVAVTAEIGWS